MTLIVDNLLPQGYVDDIEKDLSRTGFQWYYVKDVTNPNYGSNSGFVHPAFDIGKHPTEWFPYIKPLVYSLEQAHGQKIKELFRIRVGFLLPTNEQNYKYNTPHVDFLWPHYTACFYVNDSDGDTIVFDQRLEQVGTEITEDSINAFVKTTEFSISSSIQPIKNRLAIFDGFNFHASTKPIKSEKRFVITINFI